MSFFQWSDCISFCSHEKIKPRDTFFTRITFFFSLKLNLNKFSILVYLKNLKTPVITTRLCVKLNNEFAKGKMKNQLTWFK
jgi:hypothetical protein